MLSVLIGVIRKSERNLLAAVDAQIYEQVLQVLHDTEDDVVADLLVDILMVLSSLTLHVHELKALLRYLKTENRVWVGHSADSLSLSIDSSLLLETTCREIVEYLQEFALSLWS